MRARSFHYLCQHKTIYLGDGELIVGERGPQPKVVPTYPELTCHSLEDLRILNSRPKTSYAVPEECLAVYEEKVIPYWRGRSMRDKLFAALSTEWKEAYDAGLFTEFMEQRAPGHTVLDDKIYRKGLLDFKREIAAAIAALDFLGDPEAYARREQLRAMDISCDAVLLFAQRHAELARQAAAAETDPARKAELEKIAAVCTHVPAHAPRDFHEALQAYWFCHLAVITELNGWDSFSPGHLDQHLLPFYRQGLDAGTLTPRPGPRIAGGILRQVQQPPRAAQGRRDRRGERHLHGLRQYQYRRAAGRRLRRFQRIVAPACWRSSTRCTSCSPAATCNFRGKRPTPCLKHALRVISKGYGFPSIFNTDSVVEEQIRQGKTLEDARAGGCSGCVETGAFGKEAFILTGYFNLVKVLELTLHNGVDPRTGQLLGLRTGLPGSFATFDELFAAFRRQLHHFIEIKMRGNLLIEQMYAALMPAPFLSVITDDCIAKGKDYNAGGARYNNSYIQFVGIGSLTDSLAAVKQLVFDTGSCRSPRSSRRWTATSPATSCFASS